MEKDARWCLFFASVAGMVFHPGNARRDDPLTISDCARLADLMLLEYEARKEELCRGSE